MGNSIENAKKELLFKIAEKRYYGMKSHRIVGGNTLRRWIENVEFCYGDLTLSAIIDVLKNEHCPEICGCEQCGCAG